MPKKFIVILALLAVGISGVAVYNLLAPEPITSKAVAKDYKTSLTKVTPISYRVDNGFFHPCRPYSDEAIKKIRAEDGPHSLNYLDIFLDTKAQDKLEKDKPIFQEGSIIVKEKRYVFDPLGKFGSLPSEEEPEIDGVGGMIKRAPGYDPENGDWEYFYLDDKAKLTSGKIKNCIECHAKAKKTDYVFGDWADKTYEPY